MRAGAHAHSPCNENLALSIHLFIRIREEWSVCAEFN